MADTLTVTDNRTGKTYEIPIENDTISAMALRQIKVNETDFGMMSYDPAYKNTASCKSNITFIDGGKGVLRYRGYPIEQLAEKSTYIEVAYPAGARRIAELPEQLEMAWFTYEITHHTYLARERFRQGIFEGVPLRRAPDGHAHVLGCGRAVDVLPRSQETSTIADVRMAAGRAPDRQDAHVGGGYAYRLQPAACPTSTRTTTSVVHRELPLDDVPHDRACATSLRTRCSSGPRRAAHPPRRPRAELLGHRDARSSAPRMRRPVLGRSSAALPRRCTGRCHGGANEAVVRMLEEIGSVENIPAFIKSREGRRAPPDGLRAPRLQELRPARPQVIKRHRPPGVRRGHGPEPPARHRLRNSKSTALADEYFIEQASSTRTSTSTPASSTRRWACRWTCTRCSSRSAARRRLARAVAGDADRRRAAHRAPPSGLPRRGSPRLRRPLRSLAGDQVPRTFAARSRLSTGRVEESMQTGTCARAGRLGKSTR